MAKRILVGIIYGGKSFEHEVSKMTAKSILANIDHQIFDVREIYIDKNGRFDHSLLNNIDIAFLAIHGPNGEDGKLQKFLQAKNIKYTGSGANASQINMDKIRMHRAFKKAGLSVVKNRGFNRTQQASVKNYVQKIGFPVFVKPNNTGSSVGISKVLNLNKMSKALKEAFKYDHKIIIEQAVENPREIEVGILGNSKLIVSEPGEILTNGKFFSYNKKYFKDLVKVTAKNIKNTQKKKIKAMAKKAFMATGYAGYARIDFLINPDDEILINEINTLPGCTKGSIFPKMMNAIGIDFKNLITRIIYLALE